MKYLETIAMGVVGMGTSIASGSISPEDISNVVQVIVQVVIGIATLWGLFRKKRVS